MLLVVGVYLLNLGYGFAGTGTKLKDFRFVTRTLEVSRAGAKPMPTAFKGPESESSPFRFHANLSSGSTCRSETSRSDAGLIWLGNGGGAVGHIFISPRLPSNRRSATGVSY